MLDELRLERFKAFGSAQSIPIRPLTLIFGANNSGKSSILQALLLLKQTLEESDGRTTTLLPRGGLADLHSFRMLKHRPASGDSGVTVSLRLTGSLGPSLARRAPSAGIPEIPRNSIANPWISLRFDNYRNDDILLEECVIGAGDWANSLASFSNFAVSRGRPIVDPDPRRDLKNGRWLHLAELYPDHAAIALAWSRFQFARDAYKAAMSKEWLAHGKKTSPSFHYAFVDPDAGESLLSLEFRDFVARLTSAYPEPLRLRHFLPEFVPTLPLDAKGRALTRQFPSLRKLDLLDPLAICGRIGRRVGRMLEVETEYTGPRRFGVERYHVYSGNRTDRVGASGDRTADILFSEPDTLKEANSWLSHFDIPAKLEVHRLEDGKSSSAFFLELAFKGTGVRVQLPDVGAGLRQLLPVLVQSVVSRRKLLLIEEPESNLHPRLQSMLGDLFAFAAKERKNQLVIETHSEHLVLRVQRLVRQRKLSADEVSILFVRSSPQGARIIPLRLDGEGDFLDEWPEGFFPERLGELI